MISNIFKLIVRDFRKHKMFSFIKIGGLALGITTCFLIGLYIKHELTYDKHYEQGDRIYRVVLLNNAKNTRGIYMQEPFAETLLNEFPEIELAGRICPVQIFGAGENSIRRSESRINFLEDGFMYADQAYLDILEVPFIRGDKNTALKELNSIVIGKAIAKKIFKDEDPIGQSLVLNEYTKKTLKVTGVFDDFPGNTHVQLDYLISFLPNMFGQQNCWTCYNYCTYVRVKKNTDVALLEDKLKLINGKYILPFRKEKGQIDAEEQVKSISYELQPVKDIHLYSADISQPMKHDYGDIRMIWILGAIAIFILIIACINFINLSTAKSAGRAKEIVLKKTIGAQRISLIWQSFAESLFYSLFSILLAVVLTCLLLPYFNQLSLKNLTMPWGEWWLLPMLLISSLIIGALAGIYPSLYLTSFKPAEILKGNNSPSDKKVAFRNGLVIFQFAASILLIVCTLVIYRQVDYSLNKKLGFNKEQVVLLNGTRTLGDKTDVLKSELNKLAEVENVSMSSYLPYEGTSRNGNPFWKEGKQKIDQAVGGQNWVVDEGYLPTLGLHLKEGRNFSIDIDSDKKSACIINSEMAQKLGYNDPIGKWVETGWNKWEIIGVVENFHYDLMTHNIMPLMMRYGRDNQTMLVRVKTNDMALVLKSIKSVWNDVTQNQPMNYSFLDSQYAQMYDGVRRMGKIFWSFALLAIIVACMGLFGLAEYITKQRTKEVGVRKVNGARDIDILAMLNKDFVKWVAIAFVIATPIAYYAMNKWLENFAYKTELSWWIFALAGLLALGIALLTVSWQSWKAATRNPVEALRYE